MQRFAKWIVHHRRVIVILAVLLLIPSVIGYSKTFVNYDILSYLPENLDSMIGQKYLDKDFNMGSSAMLVVDNMEDKDVVNLKNQIKEVPGVHKVIWADDIKDTSIPNDVLPDDFKKIFYSDTGTMMIISFEDSAASPSTFQAIAQIRSISNKNCFLAGMTAIVKDTKDIVETEMPKYVLVAVLLSMIVLFLSLESTIVPLIFMLGIVFPIIYNFGSNVFLGQVSYITQALAAVLQLGVTMDFSIFLLHRYNEECTKQSDRENAMATAIVATFNSITGSSLTTIAGFLALCTMSLKLGADIGIVMAKGVLLGVISTLTVLPSLLMTFDHAIGKYRHRVLIHETKKIPQFIVKHHKGILVVFVLLLIPFSVAQGKVSQYYALDQTLPQDLNSIVSTNKLKKDFKMDTTHFVLVSDQLDDYKIKNLTEELQNVDGVNEALSYEKYVGGGIPTAFEPAAIQETFNQGGHKMILVNSLYKAGSDQCNAQLDEMKKIAKSYDADAVIAGEGAMTKDLVQVADIDFKNVSVVSILAVFVIILISFKSISIPVLLVAAIEFAITVNMGIPYFTGTVIPFIASIVIGTIQLGATIDYAILMTNRFREELNNGSVPEQAMLTAVTKCSTSILTSGLTFFSATLGVVLVSRVDLIKSLCSMLARGALISMVTIIFVLPAILLLFNKVIEKTSYHWIQNKTNSKEIETA
ncbi:efflux RND transporter permease subunit [Caproicibacterium sp. BJN0003]|uniref:efflux RND transporter permease subunit n=1 Tax=Caproicibacterium sp. BJN0003 TaxID=2994078 RepID=UPI00225928CB|nr:MMPL family transporter [Caproicibacterium sp. BJN0003]UZT81363.1 MMPL family transporter [Caproicibacterium sp. BJN0003]